MSDFAPTNGKRKAASPTSDQPPDKTTKMDVSKTETPEQVAPKMDSPETDTPKTLKLTYHEGDIFAAPDNTLLIHACNTQGSWGAGIAAAFKQRYPRAYSSYRNHCIVSHDPSSPSKAVPTGSALMISPCEDQGKKGRPNPKHYIGCLFTSAKYGRKKDSAAMILEATGRAIKELLEEARGTGVERVRMCKINSARFGVPWERTVAVLEGMVLEEGWVGEVEVWSID